MRIAGPFSSTIQLAHLSVQSAMMLAEANMVIVMRLWGMAGFWNVTPFENRRMVHEKAAAAQASALAAGRAIAAGKGPAAVAHAALKPVRHRTKSNVRRLTRRGPARP